jgi:hypothetical protein
MPMQSPHVRFWGQNRHVIQDEPLLVALDHSTSAADEPISA